MQLFIEISQRIRVIYRLPMDTAVVREKSAIKRQEIDEISEVESWKYTSQAIVLRFHFIFEHCSAFGQF